MFPLLLLLQSAGDSQLVYHGRLRQLDVAIPRLEASARVDGVLDEPVWEQAARLTGFSQYRPVDGRAAEDSTEVRVWYAPDAIWFGVRAYESHGPVVRATLADRDQIDADDLIRILLDTYNDRRRALMFAVNPLGVQQDGVWSDGVDAGAAGGPGAGFRFDATIDINPDYAFESRGRVTPQGYVVEVRIPFKSLRYQSRDPQDWSLQVLRTTQHSGYEDTWTPAVRASASFLVQSGTLKRLTGLKRGLVMDASPEFTSRVDGAPRTTEYAYGMVSPELGGTLRWGLTQNLGLAATVNPDFSQIEADVGQVTVNERFALFFPEKRPFFLEGLEQYDTPNRLIYTRRITAPIAGAKLTGKVGAANVAVLTAVDDDEYTATGDHALFNILRLRRDLGASSTAGVAYTDRIEGDAYNRVLGADLRVVWKEIWFSTAQVVGSWSRDASVRNGALWDVILFDRTGRSYGNHGQILGVSPDFEAASGFVPRTDVVQATLFNRFSWYGRPGALLEQLTTFFGPIIFWHYDDFLDLKSSFEGRIEQTWLLTLRGGWGASLNVANSHQRFEAADYAGYQVDEPGGPRPFALPHGLYNLWSGSVGAATPNRALTLSANVGAGANAIFVEAARGRGWSANATAAWRPTEAIRAEARWTHLRINRARDGSRFSTADIPRLKLEYQLTRDIFFRYVGQYFAEERSALRDPRSGRPLVLDADAEARVGPAGAVTITDFRNDLLFSYKPTPGTVFFFGYGASLAEAEPFAFRDLRRTGDGFFLKASYLFRM